MQIDAESLDGNVRKIKLAGRMDVQGAHEIDLKFSSFAANQTAVIVDMSAVEFLSSIGIRTLMLNAKAVSQRGGKMVLLNPAQTITGALEMAGIDTLIPICRSEIDAIRAVSP
jgi:anti-anti-sigma factor